MCIYSPDSDLFPQAGVHAIEIYCGCGTVELAYERVDFSDVVLEIVERLEPLVQQQGIELNLDQLAEIYIIYILVLLLARCVDQPGVS